ncbi:DNA polymerase III subunit beta [Patescibacteria group bacterium]|nr:DNA polymerase III subunit beta [Patescibacteria group bacterium]
MKIELLKENLEKVVGIVSRVSNKNLSLPVLGCVVFSAEGSQVVVRATNLDVSVEAIVKAKVQEPGVVAVPAHTLSQTVSALTDQRLTLKTVGNTLVIEGERGTTSITAVDATEFPSLPSVGSGKGVSVKLPARELISAFRSVSFAASTSSVKPELASVSLSFESGQLIAAATDSFRLAEAKIPTASKQAVSGVLIPARNIPDILRAIEGAGEVEVRVGENQCSFFSDFGFLTSRVIDGAFPDYRAIIPKDSVASATCLKEDAVNIFKKVAIFTDSFNHVHLSFKPSDKVFTVRAVNAPVGETIDHIPAVLEGEDIDINFNARYITDALPVIAGDSVTFSTAGHGKPMIITDVPHKGFTYLVMPMNR